MALSICAQVLADGSVKAYPYEPLANCTFTIISYDDYQLMSESANLQFDIDTALFVDITGYLLLSFVSGHVLGRICKGLGRA